MNSNKEKFRFRGSVPDPNDRVRISVGSGPRGNRIITQTQEVHPLFGRNTARERFLSTRAGQVPVQSLGI